MPKTRHAARTLPSSFARAITRSRKRNRASSLVKAAPPFSVGRASKKVAPPCYGGGGYPGARVPVGTTRGEDTLNELRRTATVTPAGFSSTPNVGEAPVRILQDRVEKGLFGDGRDGTLNRLPGESDAPSPSHPEMGSEIRVGSGLRKVDSARAEV